MMAQESAAAVAESTKQRAGKYLTFGLAEEEYGLEILKVREIIGMMPITRIPSTPDFVMGVINLRGKVIPVINLRMKFGMPPVEKTDETCIIVVAVAGIEMSILVDHVSEVLDIAENEIEDSPSFGNSVNTDFILGMGKQDDRVTILLNIDKVLSGEDMASLSELAGDAPDTA